MNEKALRRSVSNAVKHFWQTRRSQHGRQLKGGGKKDQGSRGAVTGGAQLDGFIRWIGGVVQDAGVPEAAIHFALRQQTYLPAFFRPTKAWDLLVIHRRQLLACLEFKSQVGSFGNNINNRSEEAIGSAHDFWTAYREGAFANSPRPGLGYFMLLEETAGSTTPVGVREPHFKVFAEFTGASYARRYELLCLKMVRERLYDVACLILSDEQSGMQGGFREPNGEVGIVNLTASLYSHIHARAQLLGPDAS